MKEELKIAKENVKNAEQTPLEVRWLDMCKEHKQSCQRFLEFLEVILEDKKINGNYMGKFIRENKIQDLKQAIKLYEDNGI